DTDADAIGSALGVYEIACACGTPVKVLIDKNRIDSTVKKILDNSEYEFIKLRQTLINKEDVPAFFKGRSLLILVDHHDKELSVDKDVYNLANQIIIIDHHRLTEMLEVKPIIQYIDPNASSAVEIVTELSQLSPIEVKYPNFISTIMLIGMIIDTHNFVDHTTDRTFKVASILTSFGADTHEAKRYLRESISEQIDRVSLLQKAEIIFDHYAIIIDRKEYAKRDDLSKTADALLNIDNIEASFSIGRISRDTVSISARSNKQNVHIIMEQMGGGGHFNAAGAQVKNKSVEEVYNSLVAVIKNNLKGKGDSMKVILVEDVKKQGKKGDTIDVSTGYGNYLLSKHLAIEANASNLAVLEEQKANEERLIEEEIAVAKKLKEILSNVSIKIKVKTGANGKIFGSVSSKDVEEELKRQENIDLDKKKISLPEDKIVALGVYEVNAKLYKDINAKFNIHVVDSEEA
nr:50S ribosomal protein L9 [Gammaproteobacteria bacterium]